MRPLHPRPHPPPPSPVCLWDKLINPHVNHRGILVGDTIIKSQRQILQRSILKLIPAKTGQRRIVFSVKKAAAIAVLDVFPRGRVVGTFVFSSCLLPFTSLSHTQEQKERDQLTLHHPPVYVQTAAIHPHTHTFSISTLWMGRLPDDGRVRHSASSSAPP